jgi:hypothetical protein
VFWLFEFERSNSRWSGVKSSIVKKSPPSYSPATLIDPPHLLGPPLGQFSRPAIKSVQYAGLHEYSMNFPTLKKGLHQQYGVGARSDLLLARHDGYLGNAGLLHFDALGSANVSGGKGCPK